jgi:drug/metabolite transporter (DMT)-like permease
MKLSYSLLALYTLFWAGNFVTGRAVHGLIGPIELSFYRWFGVLILLSPILIIKRDLIINSIKKEFIILSILGTLGIAGFNTMIYLALSNTTATNALIINSSTPVIILLLSAFILKIKSTKLQVFGIILSLTGVLYLISKGELNSLLELSFNSGDIWVVLASLDWALYSVLLKFKPQNLKPLEFLSAIVLIGNISLMPLYTFIGTQNIFDPTYTNEAYMAIAYVIIFPSILSYLFWHKGVHDLGANITGQFIHLMPLFGVILAVVFLEESLQVFHFIGAFLIGLGILLSSKKTQQKV